MNREYAADSQTAVDTPRHRAHLAGMETPQDPAPSSKRFVDDLDQRLLEIFALAKEHFRTAGLAYSDKLHQFFVDLGSESTPAADSTPATDSGEDDVQS